MQPFHKSNLKQFETLKYIIENTQEHHITCIINIMIQSDKIDTPYYMDTEIAITECTQTENKGIVHAMDVLKHHRMYNITEDKYREMKKIIDEKFKDADDKTVTTNLAPTKDEIEIRTLNKSKLDKILTEYEELFRIIDDLA